MNINDIQNVAVNFSIQADIAKEAIDGRSVDQLGRFAKIYYYMFPHIWYESYLMNSIINQSFFIAYEYVNATTTYNYGEEVITQVIYYLQNKELFFRFPTNSDGFTINNNFVPNNYLLNPLVEDGSPYFLPLFNYYPNVNWFKAIDYFNI